MFSGFMVNAWEVSSIVAVVAGLVGFFVVLRGSAFVAHAVPNGSFAGAVGATLVGVNTLIGLGVFSLFGALGIGFLGRRGRHDVVTALPHLDQAAGGQVLEQGCEVAPAPFRLDVVLGDQGIADGRDGDRPLQQAPDARPDVLQAVVDAVLEAQDHQLGTEGAGEQVPGREDSGRLRDPAWGHWGSWFTSRGNQPNILM